MGGLMFSEPAIVGHPLDGFGQAGPLARSRGAESMTTKYHIDEMQGDEVVALHIAHGATALEAVQ
ncbi:hypothetical protein [Mesorhizobium sp. WSM4312]|uniref:hypothetical protein n=1 Tax=Mesorhizobium sp. WSM4312 TaxID=2029411 RepID=UPI0015C7A6D4|nr:hypothetical protein [Mesorhizobium sp. WSM4312]